MEITETEGISLPKIPSTHSPTCCPAQMSNCSSPSCVSHKMCLALLNNHRTQEEIYSQMVHPLQVCIIQGTELLTLFEVPGPMP